MRILKGFMMNVGTIASTQMGSEVHPTDLVSRAAARGELWHTQSSWLITALVYVGFRSGYRFSLVISGSIRVGLNMEKCRFSSK